MRRFRLVSAGLSLLAGCTPMEPSAVDTLRDGMARWETRGPSTYEIVVARGPCECLPEMVVPVRVSVRNGDIESVRNQQTGEAVNTDLFHALSVEGLFTLIQSALAQNAHRVTVSYDAVLGYPRSIVIHYHPVAVDAQIVLAAEIAGTGAPSR